MTIPQIVKIKNEWLYQQVDVEYPTKESIAGLALYKEKQASSCYETLQELPQGAGAFSVDDVFLVDFHRLTVMFSLLQARRWEVQADQEMILEFLSQIIYSEPCRLYLGFKSGEAVAAAIVTQSEGSSLISDVVSFNNYSRDDFIYALIKKLNLSLSTDSPLVVER
ncbi:flavodoxin [Vibrio tubiashii]|nr:flavodoxin [Vibrio tubiashii]